MERRNFIKTAFIGAIGSALSIKSFANESDGNDSKMLVHSSPDLVAVMGGEPVAMYNKAIEAMGGMKSFISKGDKVVVKPNIGWDKKPELAANTNPQLVAAIVKDCLAAGAKEVVVFDHTCDEWQASYQNSGIEEAAKSAGARVAFAHDEKYYKTVSLPLGVNMKSAKIHQDLVDCDKWINVPILKNHGGAKMTISMKNYMGIVWDRGYFHSHNLQQCIADACTWSKKPVLNIVDAYRIMTQNGPKGKSADDVQLAKALFMSQDIVAVDTAATKFFSQFKSMPLDNVGHIGMGEGHKLGTTNLESINIKRIKL